MTSSTIEPQAHETPHTEASLHRSARRGSALALVQTIAGKATSIAAQLALAWFLMPADSGLASIATSINGLLIFFNPLAMSDVLLARRAEFERDAAAGFWVSMLLAAVTTLFLLGVAVPFEDWTGKTGLGAVLAVLAFRPILSALQIVPYTVLRTGLRFGSLARTSVNVAVGSMLLAVGLGASGAGPYAIVVPPIAAIAVSAALYARAARPFPSLAFRLDGARPLLRQYTDASLGQYAHTISLFVDYLTLGFFATTAEAGYYFLAFNLSIQINAALAYNISLALQPVFTHLAHDPPAQLRSFLRNTTGIGVFTTPICALQGVLAIPIMHLLFPERWWPAAPLVAVLSAGQLFWFSMGCSASLLKAQGRFSTYSRWQAVQSGLLVPAVVLAAWAGGPWLESRFDIENGRAMAVAIVISLQVMISGPIGSWLAVRGCGGRKRDVLILYAQPIGAALVASAASWPLTLLFGSGRGASFVACAVVTTVFAIIYLLTLRFISRQLYDAIMNNGRNTIARALGRSVAVPGGPAV
ncbi:MAG: oligosaccharide flippase family protein [Phycisphaerae bacterium]|nr:oligosaccharide flippase family protein [Phycisphaerae bacterium]